MPKFDGDTATHALYLGNTIQNNAELTANGFVILSNYSHGIVPPIVSNLGEVRNLAPLVADLVCVLALVTVLYTVGMTGRLRRRETGTLRALGATPGVLAATAEIQALVLGVTGLSVGIPLGIVGGDLIWSQIAARAYLVDQPVISSGTTIWLCASAIVGLMVFATPLALSEVRRRSSLELRSE